MSEHHRPELPTPDIQPDERAGKAIVVAITTAIASFIPSIMIWDIAMRWISPPNHAEEAMGRGLEAIFIGGPAVALAFAGIGAFVTYRMGSRVTLKLPFTIFAVGALVSYLIIYHSRMFR